MHRSRLRLAAVTAVLGVLAAGAPAWAAGSKEAQAQKALKQALEEDYLQTRFDDAEQKLRAAVQTCGKACSKALRAKLYVALGSVLAGGKKELQDASDAFVEALTIDPKIEPSPDLLSTEVSFAYEQARKKLKLAPGRPPPADAKPPKKPPKPEKEEKDEAEDKPDKDKGDQPAKPDKPAKPEKEEPEAPKDPPPPPEPARKNWITLTFGADAAIVSGSNVCRPESQSGSHFVCLRQDATGSRYVGTPTLDNGDNINAGLALGTLRFMLGYDRLVHPNVTVGLRVGFAFNGASGDGVSFLPFHGEARVGFWPGRDPFVGKGVRPFIVVSGGVAQVDAKVKVHVLEDGTVCGAQSPADTTSPCTMKSSDGTLEQREQTLTVFRQNGLGFAAATFGVQFAPSTRVALNLGARFSATFPSVAAVLSPEAGLSVGF
jgi:hypothetical protein